MSMTIKFMCDLCEAESHDASFMWGIMGNWEFTDKLEELDQCNKHLCTGCLSKLHKTFEEDDRWGERRLNG